MKLHLTSRVAGFSLAILAAFGFSFKAIFVKLAYEVAPVDPVTLLMLRMSMSLPLIALTAWPVLRKGPTLHRKDYALLVVLGVAGYYASAMLDFMGLQYITAGLERLILFTYPMLTILIGVFFLGKTFEKKLLLAMLLSYGGILIAFVHDLELTADTHSVVRWCLAALSPTPYTTPGRRWLSGAWGRSRFRCWRCWCQLQRLRCIFLPLVPLPRLICRGRCMPTARAWRSFLR